MARTQPILATQFIILSLLSSFAITLATLNGKPSSFARTLNKNLFGLKKEKPSHFRLYWQDVVSGKNPSSALIVSPPSNSTKTFFGMVRMIDNALTEGPELNSKLLGRAQGFYASASQEEIGFLMTMNFVFTQGKYNGSTITVLGRNVVFNTVREMPVIGGSGVFRFARGYVEARTHKFDLKSGDATVEYNVYVLHY